MPESQVGASITVIDDEEIKALNRLDVLENLQQVPGAQVVQTGQRGGTTSLFIRGGESDFNKILIDGIPINDIGGSFDFAQLANNGIENEEVLRGANSVLYGSDALSGVVNITSTRGTTPLPEVQYSVDGGNFSTGNQDVSLSGLFRNFDYFSEFSHSDTQGSLPNDYFQNNTVSANVGWEVDPTLSFAQRPFATLLPASAHRTRCRSTEFRTIPGKRIETPTVEFRCRIKQQRSGTTRCSFLMPSSLLTSSTRRRPANRLRGITSATSLLSRAQMDTA